MGTPEEDLWRYYRWEDEQRRIEKSNQQVRELKEALGDGGPEGRARQIEVFCRQEEERLQAIRSRYPQPEPKKHGTIFSQFRWRRK